jgi:hypothetical protein
MESILSIYWTNTRDGFKISLTARNGLVDRSTSQEVAMRLPLSFREPNRNCTQEAGSAPSRLAVNIGPMESRFPARVTSVSVAGWMLMLVLLVLEWLAGRASAHGAVVVAPRITLVVFADRQMVDEQWAALTLTLRQGFDNLAVETHFTVSGFDVVRGETLVPGAQFDEVISVYLHGDCSLPSQPGTYTVRGVLGWVLSDHGQIRPFIHVDCGRISEMLGQRVFGMDKTSRNAVMAEAISRIILHEWIHIFTQNPAHSREGIAKRSFSVQDLVPDYPQIFSHGR